MKPSRIHKWGKLALLTCGLFSTAIATGCLQTSVGGQTLPSARYLRDDVQFFRAGPEFQLHNQVEALERHRLDQERIEEDLNAPAL